MITQSKLMCIGYVDCVVSLKWMFVVVEGYVHSMGTISEEMRVGRRFCQQGIAF